MKHFDYLIIGAGISGISAAHYFKKHNPNKTFAILEGRNAIGGTWDLFNYPGIRSDSDMYTFGFSFKPWTSPKTIAPKKLILDYLNETIEEESLREKIIFQHKVTLATFKNDLWHLETLNKNSNSKEIFTCKFLSLCTGYYNYEKGNSPQFRGQENFNGKIVHPQFWSQSIEYSNKNVAIIGSGATAITLLPSISKKAKHVSLVQRSPSYVVALPEENLFANLANKILPKKTAFKLNRWFFIALSQVSHRFSKKFPKFMASRLKAEVKKNLGKDFDVDTHFTPTYDVWDQRVCFTPDGDFFEALKTKKASIHTDKIEKILPSGIQLSSGKTIEADLIISATGLEMVPVCNFPVVVNDKPIKFNKTVLYKGFMFSGIPNFSYTYGYTNASWTLKADLTSEFVAKLINYMAANKLKTCTPSLSEDVLISDVDDFTPNYYLKILDKMPKRGNKNPWQLKQNYYFDKKLMKNTDFNDPSLQFH